MPYITQARRELVVTQQPPAKGVNEPLNAGELTYQVTRVVEEYRRIHGTQFQTLAEIVAALEQAKDEFQRRVVHPYEDAKCKQNGDCYDLTAFEPKVVMGGPILLPPAPAWDGYVYQPDCVCVACSSRHPAKGA